MSEWLEITAFAFGDRNDIYGHPLPPIVTQTNVEGSISPPIKFSANFFLQDENAVDITDQDKSPLSLEGLDYA